MRVRKCSGYSRHWFVMRGQVLRKGGVRTPKCVRCGAPNPAADKFTTDDWWAILECCPYLLDDEKATREWLTEMRDRGDVP